MIEENKHQVQKKRPESEICELTLSSLNPSGGSERAQRQLFRALRYHTLQDPQLHNTLKDLLTAVKAPGKGLSTAARIYLDRREFMEVLATGYKHQGFMCNHASYHLNVL